MLTCEQDAIQYISENQKYLLETMEEGEIKTIYRTDFVTVRIARSKQQLVKFVNHYEDFTIDKIFREMINDKLI